MSTSTSQSTSPASAAHPAFTPTAIAPEQLDSTTVGRAELIERLVARIRDAATTKARRHTLLVGPRGSGKTHTMAVAVHRALRDDKTARAVVLAWIPEDSLTIASYADLLVEVARHLHSRLADQARELRWTQDRIGLEHLIQEYAADRTIVLLIENLDRVFRDLGTRDAGAFRAFVETSGRVLVLASTPLLFSAVSLRSEPWYGSFDTEHLGELTVAEGAEIVRRRAQARGDAELAAYVTSPEGTARLRALAHLAGGSPRLWQILSDAVTIGSLDQLVPAVEKLLDDLAPYYQQRLWELGPIEQKLVVELARGTGAANVAELARRAGVDQRAAATALSRLSEASWVRPQKAEGGDRRKSWYDLREPLLRHHLQYRDSRGEPLRVIVEVLRGWYTPRDRRQQLAGVESGSIAERFLAMSMLGDPPTRGDSGYAARNVDDLVAEARTWKLGTCTSSVAGTAALGELVEGIVAAARSRGVEPADVANAVGRGLATADRGPLGDQDRRLLDLVHVCWNGAADPSGTADHLRALGIGLDPADPLALLIRDEAAFWAGEAGDPATARDQLAALLPDQIRVLGPDHPNTLTTRWALGLWTVASGRSLRELHWSAAQLGEWVAAYGRLVTLAPAAAAELARTLAEADIRTHEVVALLQLLRCDTGTAREWLAAYRDADGPVAGEIADDLAAAVDGDPEARMRLPQELRRLVATPAVPG